MLCFALLQPNVGRQARPEAVARHERTLEGVACSTWLAAVPYTSPKPNLSFLGDGITQMSLAKCCCKEEIPKNTRIGNKPLHPATDDRAN